MTLQRSFVAALVAIPLALGGLAACVGTSEEKEAKLDRLQLGVSVACGTLPILKALFDQVSTQAMASPEDVAKAEKAYAGAQLGCSTAQTALDTYRASLAGGVK